MPIKESLFLLLCAVSWSGFAQTILINEVVSRNSESLEDEDGDSSDWIELFNPSDVAVDVEGYGISDNVDEPFKWVFPSEILGAGEYLILFSSGKDRGDSGEYHTNFRISGDGEELQLTTSSGQVIDVVTVPALMEDEAFARAPNGGVSWVVSPAPTPGASNIGNQLSFSHTSGSYESAFDLTLQGVFPDSVYFTRDGSVPSPRDELFSLELAIASRAGEPNVLSEIVTTPSDAHLSYKAWHSPEVELHKGHVLRFASFRNGTRTSPVYTKTYFADGLLTERYTVPVVSLVSDSNSFFNVDTGIYVQGVHFDPNNAEWSGNAFERGDDWERNLHFTYFEDDGVAVVDQDAGIRISGGKTRQAGQKSFRLYARSDYGKKEFEHQFFDQRSHTKYERLVLRSSVGAWGGNKVISDALAQSIVEDLDFESQASRPVVVYLNGEYWGLYSLIDRVDERYLSYETEIPIDSILMWDWFQSDYDELIEFAEQQDLSIAANYQYVQDRLDIGSFIDYNIAQQFFANRDWPWTNTVHWRKVDGRKWRYVFYDLDAAFTFLDTDMFEYLMVDPQVLGDPRNLQAFSTSLYRNLLANSDYRERYISRYEELLSSTFSKQVTLDKLDEIEQLYGPEIAGQVNRWSAPESKSEWDELVDLKLIDFLIRRPCVVDTNLATFFKLPDHEYLCEPLVLSGNVEVAPNPSRGDLYMLNSTESLLDVDELQMYNTVGQKVYNSKPVVLRPGEQFNFEIPFPVNGLYFLMIQMGNRSIEKRIVIQR